MNEHRTTDQLQEGVDHVRESPSDNGPVRLIVSRPAVDERVVLETCELVEGAGMDGDTWPDRPSSRTDDGSPHAGMAVTVMNARAAALIAGPVERWPLAGDQFYVDFDISAANTPPGTRLRLGSALLEVSDQPHTGCKKFGARFGQEAWRFVNKDHGKALNMRGINCRVLESGTVNSGDTIAKL